MQTNNAHLTDIEFWVKVEGEEVLSKIAELEAVQNPSKAEQNKLRKLRIELSNIRSEAERLAAANLKWQKGEEGKPITAKEKTEARGGRELDDDPEELFGPSTPTPERDPNKKYCTFCGSEVDNITSTGGTGKPLIRIEQVLIGSGDGMELIDTVKVSVPKQIACQKCCLQIRKPIVVSRV